jgi:hypothetical protein
MRYHVSVIEKRNKLHFFYMKPVNQSWHIAEDAVVPGWIQDIEGELAQAIKNH